MTKKRTALDAALTKSAGIAGNIYNKINTGLNGDMKTILDASKLTAGIVTSAIGTGFMMSKIIQNIMNDHKRKAMLEDLIMNDAFIKQADPERVKEFYATIHYMAPKLSGDKNVVKELLQNFIKFDRVDISSIKALADTQKSMSQGQISLADKMNLGF